MPPRLSRGSVSIEKPQKKRKRVQKRALNAFAIAEEEEPDRPRVRQHRLGQSEDPNSGRKRRRIENDDSDNADDNEDHVPRRTSQYGSRQDDEKIDISEGSDSEGNTWQLGHVEEEDDSDVDSDEAFGESDEERFEGFTFRGSASNKMSRRPSKKEKMGDDVEAQDDLDEGDHDNEDEIEEQDDFGEDAVDLATMLDHYDERDEDKGSESGEEEGEEAMGFLEENEENFWDASDEEADEQAQLSNLNAFVSALPVDDHEKSRQQLLASEAQRPGKPKTETKLKLDHLLGGNDTKISRKSRKLAQPDDGSKQAGNKGKLQPALPKRQKDRLERTAANEKAKETLERWVDTVKQNRRAEHISFPLADPNASEPAGVRRLLPASGSKPATDLENAISNILRESGLGGPNAKDEEQQLQDYEELQMNKMPLEEVQARRAQLRTARDLMFREEIRAKRIRKIKSKAYRRVHRKERERAALRDVDMFGEISDEEREKLDRRRAEERMGAKHRDSKWAKAMKQVGRAAWDEDARAGIVDMARRNDELRKRLEGKDVREDSDGLSDSSEDDSDDSNVENAEGVKSRLQRKLDDLHHAKDTKPTGLSGMKFMRKAEAERKAQNEEDMDRLKRELAGEDPFEDESEEEEVNVSGRRQYGPKVKNASKPSNSLTFQDRNEFEERAESDDEGHPDDGDEIEIILDDQQQVAALKSSKNISKKANSAFKQPYLRPVDTEKEAQNPFLDPRKRKQKHTKKRDPNSSADIFEKSATKTADLDGWTTVSYNQNGGRDVNGALSDEDADTPTLSRNELFVQQGFSGDYTVEDFEKEKDATFEEEDEKVIDNGLPGWGSWTGAGVSKREQNRHKGRFLTKQDGVKPQDRKDAKLKNVIINEKRSKRNGAYLAGQLPFPYTTREEYERSMRMPVGGEWNTKVTLQNNVKPRVLVKPGRVIAPVEKPLV